MTSESWHRLPLPNIENLENIRLENSRYFDLLFSEMGHFLLLESDDKQKRFFSLFFWSFWPGQEWEELKHLMPASLCAHCRSAETNALAGERESTQHACFNISPTFG